LGFTAIDLPSYFGQPIDGARSRGGPTDRLASMDSSNMVRSSVMGALFTGGLLCLSCSGESSNPTQPAVGGQTSIGGSASQGGSSSGGIKRRLSDSRDAKPLRAWHLAIPCLPDSTLGASVRGCSQDWAWAASGGGSSAR
jgi:hypothetical protein